MDGLRTGKDTGNGPFLTRFLARFPCARLPYLFPSPSLPPLTVWFLDLWVAVTSLLLVLCHAPPRDIKGSFGWIAVASALLSSRFEPAQVFPPIPTKKSGWDWLSVWQKMHLRYACTSPLLLEGGSWFGRRIRHCETMRFWISLLALHNFSHFHRLDHELFHNSQYHLHEIPIFY